jgi:hypothetical protein
MKYPEAAYINAGHAYERASTPTATRARAEIIRAMLQTEKPHDQTEARHLIEQGREEARANA